jgi:hypothetical protein
MGGAGMGTAAMGGADADVTAFLGRLVRLDPVALVRVRQVADRSTLWGPVPWNVLVSRTVAGSFGVDRDVVVRARDWLAAGDAALADLLRRDHEWRLALPPDERTVIEEIPATELRSLGAAAADTLRAAESGGVGGRAVGVRAVRDALLDHIAIVVSAGARPVEIPQRLVQAVVRMDFAPAARSGGGNESVRVVRAGGWIGLAADYGTAWWRQVNGLGITPARGH